MPLQIDRIRALCFDIDGTLSDTDDVYVQKIARWLRPGRALLPDKDEYHLARRMIMALETPGNILHGYSDRLGLDGLLARWNDYMIERGWQRLKTKYILMQGVRELLVDLQPLFPLAIVSSRGELTARAFLEQHELTHFFQVIVAGQTVQHTKPFPDPIQYAARHMRIPPENCLMIGDTTVDILAGKAAGAQTVGVLCGFGESEELKNAGANLILNTTAELAQVLL